MNFYETIKRGAYTLALANTLFFSGCPEVTPLPPPTPIQNVQQPPKPDKLEQRINSEIAEQNNHPDKYAVLICGYNEERFEVDLTIAYQVLLEEEFKKENIYILDEKGEQKLMYPADDVATKESIDMLFSHLAKKIDDKDLLMIYITDHGQRTELKPNLGFTEISLPFGNVNEAEIYNYLSKINPKLGIVLTDICYGGGIAKRVGKENYIGISASKEDEVGYAWIGDSFGMSFFLAFRNSKNSDINFDGKVTLDEAFVYALLNHSWSRNGTQTPQIFSEFDVTKVTIK